MEDFFNRLGRFLRHTDQFRERRRTPEAEGRQELLNYLKSHHVLAGAPGACTKLFAP